METLAATAIGLVTPYLVKGAEEFAKNAGKEAFELVKRLAERLAAWWNNDPAAKVAAEQVTKDAERYTPVLATLLSADLLREEGLAADIRRLVDEMGPVVEVIQKMEIGHGVTGADIGTMLRGRVHIQQDIGMATNVIGFKATKLGGD